MTLTRQRDLRTGTPVWAAYGVPLPRARRIKRDIKTQVLVVGAGISGALLAHELTARGVKVAIVDRRGVLRGSTPASTALLQFDIDMPLLDLQRKIGRAAARVAWLRSFEALQSLRYTIRRAHIDAAVAERPAVFLSGPMLDARALAAEARARERIGLPSRFIGRRVLRKQFGLRRSAAIVSERNLIANPVALAAGLLRRALSSGLRLHAPHEITALHATSRRVTAYTRDGRTIESRALVFCTGYELPQIVPATGHRIVSTWALATRPQQDLLWPRQALLWEAAEPYLYVRATVDGRVLCGGEDEACASPELRDAKIAAKTQALQRKLARLLPQLDTRAEYAWTGSFGQSETGLPSIGAIPGVPNCYAVLGFGGNGITFSMLAARLLSAAILGRGDPDAGVFAFR